MRIRGEPAFILHRRAYRNTSLIVDGFTARFGRVSLVARAARARGRGRNIALEPFTPLMIGWYGRGDLQTLESAEANGRAPILQGVNLAAGIYLNELVLRLLAIGDAHPSVFAAYAAAIASLADGEQALEATLRRFERELLEHIGLGLILDRDSEGRSLEEEECYGYMPASGPVRLLPGSDFAGPRVTGASLIAFGQGHLYDGAVLKDCKRLTRWVLDYHLEGRPMRSRELLKAMARSAATARRRPNSP